jgi:predicted ribosome quality control (RQC) complex YloA/Tae2 family protein
VKIDVDLSLTAFANAKRYFDHKKQSSQKHLRTLEAGEKVRSHLISPLLFIPY